MITDPVTCNSSADTACHSGTSALIAFALLNGRRGARTSWHPACTDLISLTRHSPAMEVIIPVIRLKINVNPKRSRVTSIVMVVISSKPSRAKNELSASRRKSPVPGTSGPLPIWRVCEAQKGATGRGLVRQCHRHSCEGTLPSLRGSSLRIWTSATNPREITGLRGFLNRQRRWPERPLTCKRESKFVAFLNQYREKLTPHGLFGNLFNTTIGA